MSQILRFFLDTPFQNIAHKYKITLLMDLFMAMLCMASQVAISRQKSQLIKDSTLVFNISLISNP